MQAQGSAEDSLIQDINKDWQNDSLHTLAYENLIWHYIENGDSTNTLRYLDSLQAFADRSDSPLPDILHAYDLAYYYFRLGHFEMAKKYMGRSLEVATETGYPKQAINAASRLVTLFTLQGKLDSAILLVDAGLSQANLAGENKLLAQLMLQKGNISNNQGKHLVALEIYLETDSLQREIDDVRPYDRGLLLHNIGLIHLEQLDNTEKALEYFQLAQDKYIEHGSPHSIASVQQAIGRVYLQDKRFDEADSLLTTSLDFFKKVNHDFKIAQTSFELGTLKFERGSLREARILLEEARSRFVEIGRPIPLMSTYSTLGKVYAAEKNYQRSIDNFQAGLALEPASRLRENLLRDLSNAYYLNGEYRVAYDSIQQFVKLSDSLDRIEINKALQETEARYQAAQKEKEIGDLLLKQSEQELQIRNRLIVGILITSFLLLVAVYFYYRSKNRKKINDQLRSIDELKSRLFADISHEFRTPLSLIQGPVESLLKGNPNNTQIDNLHMISRNTRKLNNLVNSVNKLTQLESGNLQLNIRESNLEEHLHIIVAAFESMGSNKGLTFTTEINVSDPSYHYDPDHFETIINNLLSNAFKYTEKGGVRLSAEVIEGKLNLLVEDTGIGIASDHLDAIFKRFHRSPDSKLQYQGAGIGLTIAYELAKLHHGNLSVESALGKGSIFRLRIPVTQQYFQSRGFEFGPSFIPVPSADIRLRPAHDHTIIDKDEAIILLVEDNRDMQWHLQSLFSEQYSIVMANNGEEALALAREHIPDLILSDLMMPTMTGQELLEELKSDPRTSHIPFVMLTANHEEIVKIKGLSQGADDFLTKPFSLNELQLKVFNLIQSRAVLREKYSAQEEKLPDAFFENEADKQFWEQINDVIATNLDNTTFTAEDFAKSMYMSRMQLHRKLKALTNLSTSLFLRKERLKASRKLLKNPSASITTVAFDVGFNSVSFFGKCFKEEFGMTPTDFQKHQVR